MKKTSTFLLIQLFLFAATFCFGQGLKYEKGINDNYHQLIQQVANKGNFSYALVEYEYHNVFLEKYDSLGVRLAKVFVAPDFGFSSFKSNRMVITNDGNIWISGVGMMACDIPLIYQHLVVYDANCQLLTIFTKELGSGSNSQNYLALSAVSDTSVATNYINADSSWIEMVSPTNQIILPNVQTPPLVGFSKNNQFHLLGHTFNKIYGIDAQGNPTDSIELPGFFQEIGTWNDTIIALGYNTLYKVTPDLLSYTLHPIPNASNFSRLKIDAQGVRFMSSNFNKGIHYLDHALNNLSTKTVPVFDPNNTVADFDAFVTVAKDFSLSNFKSVRLANYSLSSPANALVKRSDIAIIDFQITDAYATKIAPGNVYKTDAKANLLVKNEGPNIADSVRLNHLIGYSSFCGEIVHTVQFNNLNLAVGDSVWLDFGWLGEYTQNYSGDSLNRVFCVYSSNPNGIVDLNTTNDQGCRSHFFGFVGLDESTDIRFEIYPNPTLDLLHVAFPAGFTGDYVLTDQSGRVVMRDTLNSVGLDVSRLNSGVYFITLSHPSGTTSLPKRWIKL